jgi:multidrug efflux pump subunit AcrA (membrane-fusion protein)
MNSRWRWALTCFCLTWSGALVGCSQSPPHVAPAEPPAVPVSQPVHRVVTDYVDFTGRTDAVQAVDIRPRVTGYLVEMPFKEGAEVKKDSTSPRLPTTATTASPPRSPVPSASRLSINTRRR